MEFFFPKNIKLFLNLILAANLIVLIAYLVESSGSIFNRIINADPIPNEAIALP